MLTPSPHPRSTGPKTASTNFILLSSCNYHYSPTRCCFDPLEMQSTACERCHRRKVRCDKKVPQCSPCSRADTPCQYSVSEHQLRRRNTLKLERRIRDLEAENEALLSRLHHAQQQPAGRPTDNCATPATPQLSVSSGGGNDEVAEEVHRISLIAGGGHHFVGSTSGLLLANLLQSCTQTTANESTTPTWTSSIQRQKPQITQPIPQRPPKSLASDLLRAYCGHDHLCYPFLSIKALYRSLDAVYENDGQHNDPVDAFFVDMVLAIATAQVHKFNWNGVYDAETNYNRAMTELSHVLAQGGVERLQALLLICQYRMGTTSSDTTTSVWHLIGVAARTCLEMGLHRASTYDIDRSKSQGITGVIDDSATVAREEELELKRRCFWSLVALDRVTSLALGRPLAIQIEDVDVDLPASYSIEKLQSYPRNSPGSSLTTSIFVHIVRYRLICGKIANALHRKSGRGGEDIRNLIRKRQDLAEELEDWNQETENLTFLALDPANSSSSSFRSREWYRLLYHNGMLMLFRPSPYLCDAAQNKTVLRHIYNSSREAINHYASLHRSRRMNYSWITMHSVFNAGLSYIYTLRNHIQALHAVELQAQLENTPSINQVVNDTRACSKVLVAVSERWDMAGKCSDLFDRLSDAVLSDIVEAQKTPLKPVGASENLPRGVPNDGHFATPADTISKEGNFQSNPGLLNMNVDDTFRDCFGDLQDLSFDDYHNDAISQLSQGWFFGLDEEGNGSGMGGF